MKIAGSAVYPAVIALSIVTLCLVFDGVALADLRVDDRVDSRVERREDRRENAGDGVEDRVEFRGGAP